MHERTIEWDGINKEWRCKLDDQTTLITKTLRKMEDDLDYIDNRKEKQDATTEQESR